MRYEIRKVQRPDGRTIWRLIEISYSSSPRKEYEEGIAAFDSEREAKSYLNKYHSKVKTQKRKKAK